MSMCVKEYSFKHTVQGGSFKINYTPIIQIQRRHYEKYRLVLHVYVIRLLTKFLFF